MFFIYKITNNINNKIYIGSSSTCRGYQTRWEEHKKASQSENNQSYNYPLQKAMRKYGIENFSYEIIQKHIKTYEERYQIERQYIIYFNSLVNDGYGYNQTLETKCALCDSNLKQNIIEKMSKKCCLVDEKNNIIKIFPSVNSAAKYAGCEKGPSNITKVCNGEVNSINSLIFRWLDEKNNVIIPEQKTRNRRRKIVAIPLKNPNQKIIFESVSEASKFFKTDRTSIQRCLDGVKRYSNVKNHVFRDIDSDGNIIENNIPLEEVFSKYIEINGEYKTFSEWCDFYNITRQSIYARMKKYNIGKKEALLMKRKNKGE